MQIPIRFIVFILLILSSNTAFSADIGRGNYLLMPDDKSMNIYFDGRIEKGDYDKLVALLIQQPKLLNLNIHSPGGDVVEAMKIGKFARDYLLEVHVTFVCNSACFLILAGATKREADKRYTIGLHRPVYEKQYFSNLSSSEAEREYDRLDKEVRKYLIDMNIPTHIIDLMMTTPSDRVSIWDGETMLAEIGKRSPAYHEWAIAKCDPMSEEEERDLEDANTLASYQNLLKVDPDLAKEIESAAHDAAKSLPNGYRDNLSEKYEKYLGCILSAESSEREKVLKRLK